MKVERQSDARARNRLRCPGARLQPLADERFYCPKPHPARPIRSENRALLIASIAKGRRWLHELMTERAITVEAIAQREGCSVRKVNMTISLAFLAPDLVKAVIEGRLPYGMGVTRLCELPPEWSRQYRVLGLVAP